MVAVSPLAMLRSLALGGQGFGVPQVQRVAVAPPSPTPAPVTAPPAEPLPPPTGGAPSADVVPMPRPRPAGPVGGGSYALPSSDAGLSKLRDVLTAAAMGTAAAPPGAGMIQSAAAGFAGARKHIADQKAAEAAATRMAEQDALDAEYKRAQIANLEADANKTYRPLTDPAERARYGIPETDKGFYQIGPDNRVYGGTGAGSEAGQTERIVSALQSENPDLSYAEALALAQSAPNKSADILRRESLAMTAAKEDNDFAIDPETTLNKWRQFYGLEGPAPVKPKKKNKGGGKGKNKPPAGAATEPPPDQPPAATPSPVYVNPETGERIVYDGKAWVAAP